MPGPRVRFAPAPSGYLHLGSARTALFNWMFARAKGGTMLLRLEDTDPANSSEEYVHVIERGLRWLGIDWDEPPVRQSQRVDEYQKAADRLLCEGRAYWCACTREEIDARVGKGGGYDGWCRDRGAERAPGRPLRFRVPPGETVVHDLIRGDVRFAHELLEDFVLVRSDGRPGFYIANAIDDMEMGITHVVRGEDLLPATPRVLLLRGALGGDGSLTFAHLPLIVDEQRQKLSKRKHSVAIEEFREKGYLAEALRNYVALLGWAPPSGEEILPIERMVEEFELEDIIASPAYFDSQKLDHVNATYIRALPVATFVRDALPWLETTKLWPAERFELAKFEALAPLVQERARTLSDACGLVDFVFLDEPVIDQPSWDKVMALPAAAAMLDGALGEYPALEWQASVLHDTTAAIGERYQLKLGKAQAPIRVAVTGRSVGPPLFESLEVLGRDETLARLRRAREKLGPA